VLEAHEQSRQVYGVRLQDHYKPNDLEANPVRVK
jgi:hypothetical protein